MTDRPMHADLSPDERAAHEAVADLMTEALAVLAAVNGGDQKLAALKLAVVAKNIWEAM